MPRLNHWAFDWLETIVVALLLALVIRAFFLQVFWIPSESMVPSLDIGDRIVVNKVIYHFRQPRRFEVVVFRQTPEVGPGKKDLIKRLVGLPGEKLQIKNGVIFINDQPVAEKHPKNEDFANFGPVNIPQEHCFVMGDNRAASFDSRYWKDSSGTLKFLPMKNLIGQAICLIWPLNKIGLIL
ncbi:MAG: signal peptidase I [Candidatus Margulisbacteria bacterium]|nr:signal peptidase I [Candidatus Margulisiibacteriota bacterium]